MFRHQYARLNDNIKRAKISFENMVTFRYLGTTVINKLGLLQGEHRLRVLENRVLRRILGPKSDEKIGCR
jgi:hypothetical protein